MAGFIKGITIEFGADTTKLNNALQKTQGVLNKTQSELKQVNTALKFNPGNTTLLKQKFDLLKNAVTQTEEKLKQLRTMQSKMDAAGVSKTTTQYRQLEREIIKCETGLKTAEKRLRTFGTVGKQQIAAVAAKAKTLGTNMASAGRSMAAGVTMPLTLIGGAAARTTADFDSAMSKVQAISGATGSQFDALREKAREMGANTKFSATESAEALTYMAMAGWKTDDMLGGLEGIMNLAAASGEDLATTSDIVTDALTAFGLKAEDSGHFADVLAAASSNANTNVGMMGETFKYAAPIAGALGYSIEDTAEAIGLMANAGIKSSQAGTSLRTIMTKLSKDFVISGKNIGNVTIATTNADGSMRSLNDILADSRAAFSGLTESEKAAAAESLVGKNAMSGFLALMNASPTDIEKLETALASADGTASNMAETMQDNFGGQLTILKSQLSEAAISIGDTLVPFLKKLVEIVQTLTDKFNSLSPAQKQIVVVLGIIAAAIGPLIILVGTLITSIAFMTSAVTALDVAILPIIGTVAAVVAGIAALIAIGVLLYKNWDTIKKYATKAWGAIKKAIITAFTAVKNFFVKTLASIKAMFLAAFNLVKSYIVNPVKNAVKTVKETIKNLQTSISTRLSNLKQTVSDKFNAVKDAMLAPIEKARDLIQGIIEKIKGFFNFKAQLPKIELPHFAIEPPGWHIGDLLQGIVPWIGIDWYKNGGIFNRPTVAGLGDVRGGEAALPLEPFWNKMDKIVEAVGNVDGGTTINIYASPGMDVNALAAEVERRMTRVQKQKGAVWT